MKFRALLASLCCLGPADSALRADPPGTPTPQQLEFFEARVRPVLAEHCFSCHGPKKQTAGLRLDSRAALLRGGESGPASVPGQPEKSLLINAVRHSRALRMPPKG